MQCHAAIAHPRDPRSSKEEFGGPALSAARALADPSDRPSAREILPLFRKLLTKARAGLPRNLAREIGKAQVAPLTLGNRETRLRMTTCTSLLGEIGAHLPGFELTLQSGSSEEMIGLGLNGAPSIFFCGRSARRRARQVRSLVAVRPCLSYDHGGAGASAGEPGCSDAR